jgi:CrcB protein
VLLAVGVGGVVGGLARYGVAELIHDAPNRFPWATFWTNVTGSCALGLVLGVIVMHFRAAHHTQAFIATGFLGAYTTYSTFAVQTDVLIKDGHALIAIVYTAVSLVAGVVAAGLGVAAAHTTAPAVPDEEEV